MPRLTVGNGFTTALPGVGRNQSFSHLSEKRITRAVRAGLREDYGHQHVEVSCAAAFENGEWVGMCQIEGEPRQYRPRWTSENRQFIDRAKPAIISGGRDQ